MGRSPPQTGIICVVLLACLVPLAYTKAPDFGQCLNEFRNDTWGNNGGVDDYGNPVSDPSLADGITYSVCIRHCGTGAEGFEWSMFSQQFSAWLLPWLALVSQLPFGAKNRLDNLTSVLLAVGSPALAAYSLALTILNGRWAARRFTGISYPNARYAFRILSSLQQAPLTISNEGALLASLIVLPENDDWWADLCDWLNYVHTWSISAATSIAWVIIAYLFTVIDSFTTLDVSVPSGGVSDGQATGTVWLWLLAVVIGWLQISPKCDSGRLRIAMARANAIAHTATDSGQSVPANEVSHTRAFSLLTEFDVEDAAQDDEMCSAPIYNYARFLPWALHVEEVASAFRSASRKAAGRIRADGSRDWHGADRNVEVDPRNRTACLEAIDAYCSPPPYARRSHWVSGVISRFLLASFIGLGLQWGTTGAAIVVLWYTPSVGLGCRSGSYLLYAVASTIAWAMLVLSAFLVHYSTSLSSTKDALSRQQVRDVAVVLRRLAKLLATANALWVITASLLQFSNFYNRCYCDAQMLDIIRGAFDTAYDMVLISPEQVKAPWTGGVVLGCGCAALFVAFVNLFLNPGL